MQPTPYKKELNRKIKDDDDDDDDEEERSMSHSSDGETRMFPADVDVSFVSNTEGIGSPLQDPHDIVFTDHSPRAKKGTKEAETLISELDGEMWKLKNENKRESVRTKVFNYEGQPRNRAKKRRRSESIDSDDGEKTERKKRKRSKSTGSAKKFEDAVSSKKNDRADPFVIGLEISYGTGETTRTIYLKNRDPHELKLYKDKGEQPPFDYWIFGSSTIPQVFSLEDRVHTFPEGADRTQADSLNVTHLSEFLDRALNFANENEVILMGRDSDTTAEIGIAIIEFLTGATEFDAYNLLAVFAPAVLKNGGRNREHSNRIKGKKVFDVDITHVKTTLDESSDPSSESDPMEEEKEKERECRRSEEENADDATVKPAQPSIHSKDIDTETARREKSKGKEKKKSQEAQNRMEKMFKPLSSTSAKIVNESVEKGSKPSTTNGHSSGLAKTPSLSFSSSHALKEKAKESRKEKSQDGQTPENVFNESCEGSKPSTIDGHLNGLAKASPLSSSPPSPFSAAPAASPSSVATAAPATSHAALIDSDGLLTTLAKYGMRPDEIASFERLVIDKFGRNLVRFIAMFENKPPCYPQDWKKFTKRILAVAISDIRNKEKFGEFLRKYDLTALTSSFDAVGLHPNIRMSLVIELFEEIKNDDYYKALPAADQDAFESSLNHYRTHASKQ